MARALVEFRRHHQTSLDSWVAIFDQRLQPRRMDAVVVVTRMRVRESSEAYFAFTGPGSFPAAM